MPARRWACTSTSPCPSPAMCSSTPASCSFPFRRYQIQKVWRGERPQEGRYREFVQADIDVVDVDTLAPQHDAEMARVMAEALSALPLPPFRLQVNNRKLIEGFYRGLGIDEVAAVMRAVDKLDKIGAGGRCAPCCWRRGRAGRRAGSPPPGVGGDLRRGRLPRRATGPWARGERPAARRGAGRADRRPRGHHVGAQRPGRGGRRPVHRPRARLLHRHRLRDPDGRLRVARVDLLGRALRRAGQRRADDLPGGGDLLRGDPGAGPAVRAGAAHGQPADAVLRGRRGRRRGAPG